MLIIGTLSSVHKTLPLPSDGRGPGGGCPHSITRNGPIAPATSDRSLSPPGRRGCLVAANPLAHRQTLSLGFKSHVFASFDKTRPEADRHPHQVIQARNTHG